MSDNENKKEEVVPAYLQDGEPVMSKEQAEKFTAFVKSVEKPVEAVEVAEDVISSPEPVAEGKPSITYGKNGVMTSGTTKEKPQPKVTAKKKEEKKIAIYSTKNVRWYEVGKVVKGYNILPESEAKKWLERDHIRLVEPEEVKRELDN